MAEIARIAIEQDLTVLSYEAHFEMRHAGQSASIASLPGMDERTVILNTFSKIDDDGMATRLRCDRKP